MPPELIASLVLLAAKYGPEFVASIIALLKQKTVSIEDVEKLFSNVKPYADYNIPDIAPSSAPPNSPPPPSA